MNTKILCCDDEANILAGFQRNLRKQFTLTTVTSGDEALKLIEREGPFAVVVADMQMPVMNGIQLLTKVEERWPDTVRIMLTGNADQQTAVEAVNQGHVFRFLNKPCTPETLASTLDAALKQYRLICAEKELLEQTLNGAIQMLSDILMLVDPNASGRGQTLREHMKTFLESLGVPCRWEFEIAAMLSPIGYVTVPQSVMQRANAGVALTDEETNMLRRVPETGSKLIAKIPRLEPVAEIVLYQNKNFDGTGLPADGRAGEEIPVASRILHILGNLAQMEAHGISKGEALMSMQQQAGFYDPRVLDAAFKCFDAYLPHASADAALARAVHLSELHPGHILRSDIETNDGTLLLLRGGKITPVILEKIRNFQLLTGIKEPIYVAEES
jgi:response regulator RpfG family c-di-GMP phosphodiesterase